MAKNNGTASLNQAVQAQRMNLAQWRAARLHDLTLPSGLPVRVRDVDVTDLALLGEIPNTLLDVLGQAETQALSEDEIGKKMLGDNKNDFAAMLAAIVKAALVEPAIGEKADDEHILLAELSFADKMEIFNFINRDANAVRPFREGIAEPVAAA